MPGRQNEKRKEKNEEIYKRTFLSKRVWKGKTSLICSLAVAANSTSFSSFSTHLMCQEKKFNTEREEGKGKGSRLAVEISRHTMIKK